MILPNESLKCGHLLTYFAFWIWEAGEDASLAGATNSKWFFDGMMLARCPHTPFANDPFWQRWKSQEWEEVYLIVIDEELRGLQDAEDVSDGEVRKVMVKARRIRLPRTGLLSLHSVLLNPWVDTIARSRQASE